MRRLARTLRLLLLPLSLVPLAVGLPLVQAEYDDYRAEVAGREPIEAPPAVLAARDLHAFARVPAYGGLRASGIPVLVYHGLAETRDKWTITPEEFARQIALLDRAGFETVSMETWARFMRGEQVRLPEKPVLITFDDGRLDSWRAADPVLERHGFRATMFAITGQAGAKNPFYLRWDELEALQRSGRWDVQLHAHEGHRQVRVRAAARRGERGARRGPWFANRMPREPFAAWRARVRADLARGLALMREHVPGFRPFAFALPYGDFGQLETNDRRIPRSLQRQLRKRFGFVMVQSDEAPFASPDSPRGRVERFEIRKDQGVRDLARWLRREAR